MKRFSALAFCLLGWCVAFLVFPKSQSAGLGEPRNSGVDAVFADDEIPEGQEKFLELNKELSQIWPVITVAPTPPEDADDWRDVKDKLKYLER